MPEFGLGCAFLTVGSLRTFSADPTFEIFMKQNDTQKYGIYLRKLSTDEIERLLSSVLHEMRRRDSETMKNDVMATSKALAKVGSRKLSPG